MNEDFALPDNGYRRSPADHRDHMLSVAGSYAIDTPPRWEVDRRYPLTSYDQGDFPSCVGWMIAMLKTVQERKDKFRTIEFDGKAFYDKIALPDGGAYLRDALKLAAREGVPDANGKLYRIAGYAAVNPRNHEAVRQAIISQRGLIIGFAVTRGWARNGGREFNSNAPGLDTVIGGHGMYVSGYEPVGPIGLNSWGEKWSEDGRGELPWAYWDKHVWECWTVQDVDD